MALRTSVGTGNWSAAGTWDTGVPVNGDTFAIAAGHTVTFDVDQSGMANGMGASSIAATGTLVASTGAGSHYLKMNADLTLNGTLQAGTSVAVPYPSTCTFTIDFNNTAHSIERSATGSIKLYCLQPTNRYIYTDAQALSGQPILSVATDVTGDIWAVGDSVCIVDSSALDVQYSTIAAAGIAADQITLNDNLDSNVETGSMIVLVQRNIRIINVAASDYAITFSAGYGSGDYIGAELNSCYRGLYNGAGFEFAGTMNLLTTSPYCIVTCASATVSGALTGTSTGNAYAFNACNGMRASTTALFAGFFTVFYNGSQNEHSGLTFGSQWGSTQETGSSLASSGVIDHCSYGFNACSGTYVYGDMTNNNRNIYRGTDCILANNTLDASTSDIEQLQSGKAHNVSFGATEFVDYTSVRRGAHDYFESFDHDQVENAFKAWCRGGIVTSQTTSPPTGYTIWYEFAAEDTTQEFPVFRQYETTVLPGQSIEVTGKIRIADGEDLSTSGLEPQLQIVDKFADPLVDSTQSPLDYNIPADVTGAETGWQDVSVIWANQGESPRRVIVRMIAYNDGGADTVYVDGVWAASSYQEDITEILRRVKRLGMTSEH